MGRVETINPGSFQARPSSSVTRLNTAEQIQEYAPEAGPSRTILPAPQRTIRARGAQLALATNGFPHPATDVARRLRRANSPAVGSPCALNTAVGIPILGRAYQAERSVGGKQRHESRTSRCPCREPRRRAPAACGGFPGIRRRPRGSPSSSVRKGGCDRAISFTRRSHPSRKGTLQGVPFSDAVG